MVPPWSEHFISTYRGLPPTAVSQNKYKRNKQRILLAIAIPVNSCNALQWDLFQRSMILISISKGAFWISTYEVAGLWPGATGMDQSSDDPLDLHWISCNPQALCSAVRCMPLPYYICVSRESHFKLLCHSPLNLLRTPGAACSVHALLRADGLPNQSVSLSSLLQLDF